MTAVGSVFCSNPNHPVDAAPACGTCYREAVTELAASKAALASAYSPEVIMANYMAGWNHAIEAAAKAVDPMVVWGHRDSPSDWAKKLRALTRKGQP